MAKKYRLKPESGPFSRRENGVRKTYLPGDFVEGPIPKAFHASFEGIEDEASLPDPPATGLKAIHRVGPWYDVVDETGEKINDSALRKEEAESLARDGDMSIPPKPPEPPPPRSVKGERNAD